MQFVRDSSPLFVPYSSMLMRCCSLRPRFAILPLPIDLSCAVDADTGDLPGSPALDGKGADMGDGYAALHRELRQPTLLLALVGVVQDNGAGSGAQRAAASALVAFCEVTLRVRGWWGRIIPVPR